MEGRDPYISPGSFQPPAPHRPAPHGTVDVPRPSGPGADGPMVSKVVQTTIGVPSSSPLWRRCGPFAGPLAMMHSHDACRRVASRSPSPVALAAHVRRPAVRAVKRLGCAGWCVWHPLGRGGEETKHFSRVRLSPRL